VNLFSLNRNVLSQLIVTILVREQIDFKILSHRFVNELDEVCVELALLIVYSSKY